jgi:HK97 family phage portal protein
VALVDRVAARRRDRDARRAADPVSLEEFGYLLGRGRGNAVRTRAGVTVGSQRALGITAWYSGVRYLAEGVSTLPIGFHRERAGRRFPREVPPWAKRPDRETPWPALVEHWIMCLCHKGNAYAFKLRDVQGRVFGLRALHADRVVPGQASDGTKVFKIDGRDDVGFTSREVLHIPGLSYDGIVGLNPIATLGESLGAIAAADEHAARFFGQGSHLHGYVSVPETLDETEANLIKAQWERFHRGLANAYEFGVLGNGATYQTVGLNPEETQLLESRRFGVTEVARMLRIPPHKLYDLERATFSNIEHQAIEAVTDSLRPWVERIETWVNYDLDLSPADTFLEFELEGLLRGDTAARAAWYTAGISGGWMMPAEPREREGLEPVDGLRYFQRPLNVDTFGPDAEPGGASAREVAEILQKLYLAVGVVITQDEARKIAAAAGGSAAAIGEGSGT